MCKNATTSARETWFALRMCKNVSTSAGETSSVLRMCKNASTSAWETCTAHVLAVQPLTHFFATIWKTIIRLLLYYTLWLKRNALFLDFFKHLWFNWVSVYNKKPLEYFDFGIKFIKVFNMMYRVAPILLYLFYCRATCYFYSKIVHWVLNCISSTRCWCSSARFNCGLLKTASV